MFVVTVHSGPSNTSFCLGAWHGQGGRETVCRACAGLLGEATGPSCLGTHIVDLHSYTSSTLCFCSSKPQSISSSPNRLTCEI